MKPQILIRINLINCLGLSNILQLLTLNFYDSLIFFAIFPPIKAIGIYATMMSQAVNHIGAGNIKLTAMPPSKNKAPITNENFIL